MSVRVAALWVVVGAGFAGGCRGAQAGPGAGGTMGPLQVAADYHSFTEVTRRPFFSTDHGGRWSRIYVNAAGMQVGLATVFQQNAALPVGSIIVDETVEDAAGKPSTAPGPLFVMEKRAAGYAPRAGNWWWGLYWQKPPAHPDRPLNWHSPQPQVAHCAGCHRMFVPTDWLGRIPAAVLVP